MENLIAGWGMRFAQAFRGRYVGMLEEEIERARDEIARGRAEIDRLRAENRALLNSLLGTAGVPPIETPPVHPASIAPVRRRSWPQISSAREFGAVRDARNKQS